MSQGRSGRNSRNSREVAIEAARMLLIEEGPSAITLKAVAKRMGRTHASLLHHFGSAEGLQQALAGHMAQQVIGEIGSVVIKIRKGEGDPREIIDLAFDALDQGGFGVLASWVLLTGNQAALEPVMGAVDQLIKQLGIHEDRPLHAVTLGVIIAAYGDAMIGNILTRTLGLPRELPREFALQQLRQMAGMLDTDDGTDSPVS